MKYYLATNAVLRSLERPCVYKTDTDDLYELDDESFNFLAKCGEEGGHPAEESEFIAYCLAEGILSTGHSGGRRPFIRKSPDPSLRYLELQITRRCNLRCRHCFVGDGQFSELSTATIGEVLGEFEELQGLRVLITGGEPLMHSRFAEINEMLPDFALRKVLFTNGLLIDKGLLKRLNVEEVQISIDGLEDGHDALRGQGTFIRTLSSIRLCAEFGIPVSVSTMVHSRNLGDFDEMERLFEEIGIREWTVDVPCETGRLMSNPAYGIPPEAAGRYLRYGYGGGLHAGARGYACGLHLASVTADGAVARCAFYSERAVGSSREGLGVCWNRIRPVRLKELACDCLHIETCRGGCRYRAELLGDALGKDLYRCSFHDIMERKERAKGPDFTERW